MLSCKLTSGFYEQSDYQQLSHFWVQTAVPWSTRFIKKWIDTNKSKWFKLFMQQTEKCKAMPLWGEAVVQQKKCCVLEDTATALHLAWPPSQNQGEPFNPDFLTRLWSIRPNRNYLGNPIQSFSVPLFVKKGMIALPFFHPLPAFPGQSPRGSAAQPTGAAGGLRAARHCHTKQGQVSSLPQ